MDWWVDIYCDGKHHREGVQATPFGPAPAIVSRKDCKTLPFSHGWGYFSYCDVLDLVILPKNMEMNQVAYLNILTGHLPNSFESTKAKIFLWDGAPCHSVRSFTQWLNNRGELFQGQARKQPKPNGRPMVYCKATSTWYGRLVCQTLRWQLSSNGIVYPRTT